MKPRAPRKGHSRSKPGSRSATEPPRAPRTGHPRFKRGSRPSRRLTELGLIQSLRQSPRGSGSGVRVGIGDDCAVVEPTAGDVLLVTTDLLLEDVHFRRRYAQPADIGWKAIAVNLSDIAAMGGRPRWALVALACPGETDADEVAAFYDALGALAAAHDTTVVGGDTSRSPNGWIVNLTLVGEARRPVLRSTARPGDVLAVTGPLGRSGAGLAVLEREAAPRGIGAAVLADLTGAHLRPRPRVAEGRWLGVADGVSAMIDLSDGLATDLGHITDESGVGARVELERLPIDEATLAVATALGGDARSWATAAGEDYELLFSCAPEAFAALEAGLATATGTRPLRIGEVTRAADGIRFVDGAGRAVPMAAGFEHFVTGHRRG